MYGVVGRVAVLTVVSLLVGPACDPEARPRSARPSQAPTPVRFDPGFANGDRCPISEDDRLPPRAGCVTEVDADLDGDGGQDAFFVYAIVDGRGRPGRWSAEARLSGGDRHRLRLDATRHSYPMALGAQDIDEDGTSEVFVKVFDYLFHSASSSVVGIFLVDEGELRRVTLPGGEPLDIGVGGLTQVGEGAECRDAAGDSVRDLVVLRITTRDHSFRIWHGSERAYSIDGPTARLLDRRTRTVRADSYNDPDVRRYYQLSCGEFDPPYPF